MEIDQKQSDENGKEGDQFTRSSLRARVNCLASSFWVGCVYPHWRPLVVFTVALVLRLFYNLIVLNHRVCDFGDSQFFLNSANEFVKWLQERFTLASGWGGTGPIDHRLLPNSYWLGGPLYVTYLAILQLLIGASSNLHGFVGHCLQFSLVNSLIDSFTCVLIYSAGRFAFDRQTALTAGLLFAFYPAAIINTQQCNREPFAYFLLSLWVCLIFSALLRGPVGPWRKGLHWLSLGLVAGALALVNFAFAGVPIVTALALVFLKLIASKRENQRVFVFKQSLLKGVCFAIGLLVTICPWVVISGESFGYLARSFKQALTLSAVAGNNLQSDGWRIIPLPNEREAADELVRLMAHNPIEFVAMELRKVPRLWAGSWNDNQYDLPFLAVQEQDLLHCLILFAGFFGVVWLLSDVKCWQLSHRLRCCVVLCALILCHFVYCLFEPVSRQAVTAMPLVALLSALAIVQIARAGNDRGRLIKFVCVAFVLLWLTQKASFEPLLSELLVPGLRATIPWLDALIWASLWFFTGKVMLSLVQITKQKKRFETIRQTLYLTYFFLASVVVAHSLTDPERKQWWVDLENSNQFVKQDIYVPPLAASGQLPETSFLLVDLTSPVLLPHLLVAVNGNRLIHLPMPWLQVRGGNDKMVRLLAKQSTNMGIDIKSLRQWWAIPFPTTLLKFGAPNEIMITNGAASDLGPLRIYGDYSFSNFAQAMTIPSLDSLSWEKGFATFDHGDVRVYERARIFGRDSDCRFFDGKSWQDKDLSPIAGRQFGQFRIRLAMPIWQLGVPNAINPMGLTRPPFLCQPIIMVGEVPVRSVTASSRPSMLLTEKPIKLPLDLPPGAMFLFFFQVKGSVTGGAVSPLVEFIGEENGKTLKWSSCWQPAKVSTGLSWTPVSFSDEIPDGVLRLKNLSVNVSILPYPNDGSVSGSMRGLGREVAVKDVRLFLMPALAVPPNNKRKWLYY